MCVSSVEAAKSRSAKPGELLVLREFPHAKGFTARDDRECQTAVCVPHGASFLIEVPEDIRRNLGLDGAESVTLVHLPDCWRQDAIRFWDGNIISLEDFEPEVTVAHMPFDLASPFDPPPAKKVRRRVGVLVGSAILLFGIAFFLALC